MSKNRKYSQDFINALGDAVEEFEQVSKGNYNKWNSIAELLKMQGFTIEATDNTRDYVPFVFYGITFEKMLELDSLDVLFFAQL